MALNATACSGGHNAWGEDGRNLNRWVQFFNAGMVLFFSGDFTPCSQILAAEGTRERR
jgi:hypothetical protein